MLYNEMLKIFNDNAISGAPVENGMYFVNLDLRGVMFTKASLVNFHIEETGECFLQSTSWTGFYKPSVILQHLSLENMSKLISKSSCENFEGSLDGPMIKMFRD